MTNQNGMLAGSLRHQETIRSELAFVDSSRLASSTEKSCSRQVEEKKKSLKRNFAWNLFRSSSDSKLGSQYHQGILKVDTAACRKNPDSCSRQTLPEVRSSLPNRKVGFKGTVTIIDTATSRKNSVSSSNPARSETLRSMRNNEANSGTIASPETLHRSPLLPGKVSSTQTLLGSKGNERRAKLPSVAHKTVGSVRRTDSLGSELNLSKHRAILSAFYPNVQNIDIGQGDSRREVLMMSTNVSDFPRKQQYEPPNRSSLLIGIDTALPQHKKKQTCSSAA